MSRARVRIATNKEPLQLGFLPLSDCAPLIYARESGLFAKYGVEVELRRETRWSDIRDEITSGELDAAQAPATLPFVTNVGLDSDPLAFISGMVLSSEGNGIVFSKQIWDEGVQDAESLREQIYRNWRRRTYTFALVSLFSPEHLILRQWLQGAGIVPDVEIRLVVIPPDQLFPTLKLGYIDGFCAGEPWISVVTEAGIGKCVAGSRGIAPGHPGKVLMVRQSFAAGREEEHERLLGALLEACAFCNRPENRQLLGEMLSPPEYVNAPGEFVETGFPSLVHSGVPGEPLRTNVFFGGDTNEPSDAKSQWIINRLYEALGKSMDKLSVHGRSPILKNIFRTDIFSRAKALSGKPAGNGTEWKSEHKALAG